MNIALELPIDRRPWLALYPNGAPAQFVPHHRDVLSQFRDQVARRPDACAIWYFECELSYRSLDLKSDAVAAWMQSQGVATGDRVSLLFQNTPDFVVVVLAAWKLGAVPTPSNPAYRSRELANIFKDCEPTVVFCETDCQDQVAAALAAVGQAGAPIVLSLSRRQQLDGGDPWAELPSGSLRLDQLMATETRLVAPPARIDGADIGLLLYTSGTTGAPKAAMLTHANLAFNAEAFAGWCGLGEHSRMLAIAPFFHITGFVCHIATAFAAGAMLIANYRFEPSLVLDVIRRTRPTYTIGAITAFNALMNAPGAEAADLASFDRIYSGGAPIPPALAEAFRLKFGVPIHSAYGMTETAAPTHIAPYGAPIPVDPVSGAFAIGVPMPSTEAVCVDDHGIPLPPGEAGELLLRGPQIMAGYFKKPEETAAALAHGWMHTGDIAFRDEAGWFYLVDRKKDVIIASGFKIWPREVEDVLYTHPAVREAAVVGVPDQYRGETVKAFVSLRDGARIDDQDLIAHCRARLAAYKVPRLVEVLDDLPKTPTGKIQRVALRSQSMPSALTDAATKPITPR